LALGLSVIVAVALTLRRSHLAVGSDDVPFSEVKRGDLDIKVPATGELKASHTMMLSAPAVGGGALQITRLVSGRHPVKKGDLIVEFDPSEQRYKLEQSRSDLLQAEQEITKANADSAVLTAQDKVALLKARYEVRRAELDVQKTEISSVIDGKKFEAAVVQARRVQAQLESDVASHKASGQASIYLAQEKLNKAKLEIDQAQRNIDNMTVTAPMDGLISIQKNIDAAGGVFFTGMAIADYREGDQAQSGSAIAEVVDPQGLEITSKISEREHDNVKEGQPVEVLFDALPGQTFHGRVKRVGGMTTHQFYENNAGGTFDVSIELADPDPRLRSGFSAQLLFVGGERKNVLYLPRQALFLKDGKHIVYVKHGKDYQQQPVTIEQETESRAVIEGLSAGTQVALIDPTLPRKQNPGGASPLNGGGTP
jgi:multidrug resistance efflux pump